MFFFPLRYDLWQFLLGHFYSISSSTDIGWWKVLLLSGGEVSLVLNKLGKNIVDFLIASLVHKLWLFFLTCRFGLFSSKKKNLIWPKKFLQYFNNKWRKYSIFTNWTCFTFILLFSSLPKTLIYILFCHKSIFGDHGLLCPPPPNGKKIRLTILRSLNGGGGLSSI